LLVVQGGDSNGRWAKFTQNYKCSMIFIYYIQKHDDNDDDNDSNNKDDT